MYNQLVLKDFHHRSFINGMYCDNIKFDNISNINLIYGDPCVGKTSLIHDIAETYIEYDDYCIVKAMHDRYARYSICYNSAYNIEQLAKGNYIRTDWYGKESIEEFLINRIITKRYQRKLFTEYLRKVFPTISYEFDRKNSTIKFVLPKIVVNGKCKYKKHYIPFYSHMLLGTSLMEYISLYCFIMFSVSSGICNVICIDDFDDKIHTYMYDSVIELLLKRVKRDPDVKFFLTCKDIDKVNISLQKYKLFKFKNNKSIIDTVTCHYMKYDLQERKICLEQQNLFINNTNKIVGRRKNIYVRKKFKM